MKKLIIISLLAALVPTALSAQDVYNMALDNATRQVNAPTANFTQTRIAQFKRTTLLYLKRKAFETMPQVTTDFLNTQAYYLSEFLTLFFDEILKDRQLKADVRKQKIYMFMDASLTHPLFGDPDIETTQAYIQEGSELTPFSLDTDWEQAYKAARSRL